MASPSLNKDKSDSADEVRSKLGEEFEEINSQKMCDALIGSFHIFPYPSSSSEIINTITMKIPDIYPSFDFEILSWSTNTGV